MTWNAPQHSVEVCAPSVIQAVRPWQQYHAPTFSTVQQHQRIHPPSTMQALQWSSWPSVKPTGNLAILHLQLSNTWSQRATLLVSSLTLSQSLNSVRHEPRPKQLSNPSQRNWKLAQQNMESTSTGTCGDWLQSEALAETHTWQCT